MKDRIIDIFRKPTIFSLMGIVVLLFGLPYGIYGLTWSGGASLGGILILIAATIAFFVLVLDRNCSKKISTSKLNLIEISLLILIFVIYSYSEKHININQEDKNIDYFILIENNGKLNNSEFQYSFPFDKSAVLKENICIINTVDFDAYHINFESPSHWKGYAMNPRKLEISRIKFYYNPILNFDNKQMDSIIAQEFYSDTSRIN
jgi:hypothetical protein